jgi:hypothetical protein
MLPDDDEAVTGDGGQLVTRLCSALTQLAECDPQELELPVLALGIDLGVTGKLRCDVGAIAQIEKRTWELLRLGLNESFLVKAIRNRIGDVLQERTKGLDQVGNTRHEMQTRLRDLLVDPDRFRAWVIERRPDSEEATWTDQQIAAERDRLEDSPIMAEFGIDRVSRIWAANAAWCKIVASTLADDMIDAWSRRAAARVIGR